LTIVAKSEKPFLVFQEGLSEILSRQPVLLPTKGFAHRAMVVMVMNESRDDCGFHNIASIQNAETIVK
jgi:hypothetical protein